jgi:tungstate transport system ATP-binding protein
MDNLFAGRLTEEGGHYIFRTPGATFQVAVSEKPGEVTHAMIHPEDILVSLTTFVSSARNVLSGTVSAVTEEGRTARLKVEAGETFTVSITGESCRELSLGLGSRVYLTFKASSVHLL